MSSPPQQDPDLVCQSPIFSLLLSDPESNTNFGSLLNHIYVDTDAFTLAADDCCAGTTGGAYLFRSFSLQNNNTVDENDNDDFLTDEAGDFGEITPEEFLFRAGIANESIVENFQNETGGASSSGGVSLCSFFLPQNNTEDEVWEEITDRSNEIEDFLTDEAGDFGEMTREEFPIRAGLVREELGYRKHWMMDGAQFQARERMQNEREEVKNKVTSETVTEDGSNYEISLSLEDLKRHFEKKLDDAVKCLGVSRSTVKRACRLHGIKRWPYRKRKKVNHHALSNPKQAAAACATVKAKYRDTVIKFQLSFSSGIAELVENVTKRLPLTKGSFSMRYEDDEGDLVLIACDEDLNNCLVSWRSLPDKKPIRIRMFIDDESITNQAP